MGLRYQVGQGWEFEPQGLCSIGGGGSSQSAQQSSQGSGASVNQSLTLPTNLQNPAFTAGAPATAGELGNLANGMGAVAGGAANLSPLDVLGNPSFYTPSPASNPLVANVTGAQNNTLGQIGSLVSGVPNNLAGAFSLLSGEMQPNFASNLATSPQTSAAISSAISPLREQFNSQTVPGLQGSFTQAGQRVGSSEGMGSSAFDAAFGNAQAAELANEGAVAGQIANNAYQTGLNIQANAPGQMASLTSSELSDLVNGLNAQALPQLTAQYGINQGLSLYQQQMNTILQALGLSVQGEQPAIGYGSESSGASAENSSSQGTSSGSSANFSLANPFSVGH